MDENTPSPEEMRESALLPTEIDAITPPSSMMRDITPLPQEMRAITPPSSRMRDITPLPKEMRTITPKASHRLEALTKYITRLNDESSIVMYTHSGGRFASRNNRVRSHVEGVDASVSVVYLDQLGDEGGVMELHLQTTTHQMKPPWLFVLGRFRPLKQFFESFNDGLIHSWLLDPNASYLFDLIIIGDGPGCLSAAETAQSYGRRVLVCVLRPSKELPLPEDTFQILLEKDDPERPMAKRWKSASRDCRKHCKVARMERANGLKERGISVARTEKIKFLNEHTIHLASQGRDITGLNFLLACDRDGVSRHNKARSFSIEQFLWATRRPSENVLVLGKSKLGVDVTTFLSALGFAITFMYPGVLWGMDKECAEIVLSDLVTAGVRVESCILDHIKGNPKDLKTVRGHRPDTEQPFMGEFSAIIDATDRGFNKHTLDMSVLEMEVTKSHVICNERDQTSVRNIYAIGAIVRGRPQNNLATDEAARLLASRLFGTEVSPMDYRHVPTVIHGPREYGTLGMTEEEARNQYGEDNVVVYRSLYKGFDHIYMNVKSEYFAKVVCVRPEERKLRKSVLNVISNSDHEKTAATEVTELQLESQTGKVGERIVGVHNIGENTKLQLSQTGKVGERIVGVHIIGENVGTLISTGLPISLKKGLTLAHLDTMAWVDLCNIFKIEDLVQVKI